LNQFGKLGIPMSSQIIGLLDLCSSLTSPMEIPMLSESHRGGASMTKLFSKENLIK